MLQGDASVLQPTTEISYRTAELWLSGAIGNRADDDDDERRGRQTVKSRSTEGLFTLMPKTGLNSRRSESQL